MHLVFVDDVRFLLNSSCVDIFGSKKKKEWWSGQEAIPALFCWDLSSRWGETVRQLELLVT